MKTIQRLEDRSEIGALIHKDLVEIENVGEALFFDTGNEHYYTFFSRWGGISINKINLPKENISLKNGYLVIKNAESDLIWPHDKLEYNFINQIMREAGI